MAVNELVAAGATTVPVQLAHRDEIGAGETPALLAEFHRDIEAYLAATPGNHPADLAGTSVSTARTRTSWPTSARSCSSRPRRPVPADDPGGPRAAKHDPHSGPRVHRRHAGPGPSRRHRGTHQHTGLGDQLLQPRRCRRRVPLRQRGAGRGCRVPERPPCPPGSPGPRGALLSASASSAPAGTTPRC